MPANQSSGIGYAKAVEDVLLHDIVLLGKSYLDNTNGNTGVQYRTFAADLKEASNDEIEIGFYNGIFAAHMSQIPYHDPGGGWVIKDDLDWYSQMWLALDKHVYPSEDMTADGTPGFSDGWLRSTAIRKFISRFNRVKESPI